MPRMKKSKTARGKKQKRKVASSAAAEPSSAKQAVRIGMPRKSRQTGMRAASKKGNKVSKRMGMRKKRTTKRTGESSVLETLRRLPQVAASFIKLPKK